MAQTVVVNGSHSTAKIRNPWGVLGLSIITFGIYHLFWWYYINRELRDYGIVKQRDLGRSPTASLLAIWFGWLTLYVATIWTIVTTTQRVKRAQEVAGVPNPMEGVIAALVWVFTLTLGGPVLLQHEINKVWRLPGQTSGLLPGTVGSATPIASPDLDRPGRLAELRESGASNDAEFDAEKPRLGFGEQPSSIGS